MKTRINTTRLAFVSVILAVGTLALLATANPQGTTRELTPVLEAQVRAPNGHAFTPVASVQEAWVARYNGPGNGYDQATAIAVDDSGNIYVTGRSSDADFSFHYATIKYNSAGQQQWVAQYTGPGNDDRAKAIAVDGSGNVYVTGESAGLISGFDYTTVKYNSAGQEQWVARYNGPDNGSDSPAGIAVDASGSVYVTGESRNLNGFSDYATVKYSLEGQKVWVARYFSRPGNYTDVARAIAVDSLGNAYVTGYSLFYTIANWDYGTIKYNSTGQQQWVSRYNGLGNRDDYAGAITVDNSGNVYVTGNSWGGGTNYDYATVKYNLAGQQQWAVRYDGPVSGFDSAGAIAVDNLGNVYVTGQSFGTNCTDYATVKYNSAGLQQWAARYDGPAHDCDTPVGVALDSMGNVYVTGGSTGAYATVKYDSSGQEEWVARYDGAGPAAIAVDGSANVYVTGDDGDYVTVKYVQGATPTPTPTPTPTVQVTVQTSPNGRAFTVDGTPYNSAQTLSWAPGSSHTIGTTSPQNAGPGVRYVWRRWSDGGAISHTVAPTTDKIYTAIFRTQYFLRMNHGTGGTVNPPSGWRNFNQAVSITAAPATGYSFSNWTGSGNGSYSGTNNPASITMNGPITETATFSHN
jgi:hypothetical protein